MAIQISRVSIPFESTQIAVNAQSHSKIAVGVVDIPLNGTERMLCEKLGVTSEEYAASRARYRRGEDPLSGTTLGKGGKTTSTSGSSGTSRFRAR